MAGIGLGEGLISLRPQAKRELIEPNKGDKRFVRRKSDGTFGKTVDVGKSLAADSRTTAKKARATALAELLIREAETTTGHPPPLPVLPLRPPPLMLLPS